MQRVATLVAGGVAARGALWVLFASTIANVFGYGYQVLMARLLVPGDYAVLTALFGILILVSLGAQVIQSATARLVAQYKARGEEAALHVFVRRWTGRILIGERDVTDVLSVPVVATVPVDPTIAEPATPASYWSSSSASRCATSPPADHHPLQNVTDLLSSIGELSAVAGTDSAFRRPCLAASGSGQLASTPNSVPASHRVVLLPSSRASTRSDPQRVR